MHRTSTLRPLLVLLGVGVGLTAAPAAAAQPPPATRGYEGPMAPLEGDAPGPTAPTPEAPVEPPTAPAPPVETPAETPTETPAETPAEPAGGDDGFEFEDLTEEGKEEELAATLEYKQEDVEGPAGKLVGVLSDSATGAPLAGARVEVATKDKDYVAGTKPDGTFELALPVGTYTVRIIEDTHEPIEVSNVRVEKDGETKLNRNLKPLGNEQVIAVTVEANKDSEGAQIEKRKESVAARDIMSREEIKKSGGGSTASVARRIVAATLEKNRYLYVRGLGHRYGNTLFDGSRVPSPEVELRTIPLDIFPSSALSAINVQKTFTPDVPADFAGASVQLETRQTPEEFIFGVSAKLGVNTATTGRTGLAGETIQPWDGVGFGNIPRALPDEIPDDARVDRSALIPGTLDALYTPEEIEALGESFLLDTSLNREVVARPNWGVGLSLGYGGDVGKDGRLGALVAADYSNSVQTQRGVVRRFALDSDGEGLNTGSPRNDFDYVGTDYTVRWSSLGLLKYDINDDHSLGLTGFYSRDAANEFTRLEGRNVEIEPGGEVLTTRTRYKARAIAIGRLGGKHEIVLPKDQLLRIDWFGALGQARADDPHLKDWNFQRPTEGMGDYVSRDPSFIFLDLTDDTQSGALDVTYGFKQWAGADSRVKIGGYVENKDREYFVRRFVFLRGQGCPAVSPEGNPLNPDSIGGGQSCTAPEDPAFYLGETTRSVDNYVASQRVYAGYGMVDLPLLWWWKISGGVRYEYSDIRVAPFDLFDPDADFSALSARLEDQDYLPQASFIFVPRKGKEDMFVRLTGAKTLARPEFRELAPLLFEEFASGTGSTRGNPGLTSTDIWNADLRWEYFPSNKEVLAVSVFYKYFDSPIERTILPAIPYIFSFRNADSAYNVGAELELRKNLGFFVPYKKDDTAEAKDRKGKRRRIAEQFSVGTNAAFIYSRVDLGDRIDPRCEPANGEPIPPDLVDFCNGEQAFADVSTSRERALQGQAPWQFNLYGAWDIEDTGVRLLYNVVGPRIDQIAGFGLPDVILEPFHDVDLVFRQTLAKFRRPGAKDDESKSRLELEFEVDNLLNSRWLWKQADSTFEAYRDGVSFTLGVGYQF
jgi:hypothetical protein